MSVTADLLDFAGQCWERRTFYKVVSSSHVACLVSVFLFLFLRGSPCSSDRPCMPVVCLKNDSILDRSRASRLHLDSHRQSRTRIHIVSLAFILRREFVNSTSNGVHFTESICAPISLHFERFTLIFFSRDVSFRSKLREWAVTEWAITILLYHGVNPLANATLKRKSIFFFDSRYTN